MYSTFKIKPYLVQIHENVVLFFSFVKPSVFAKHYGSYNSTLGGIGDHVPFKSKKIPPHNTSLSDINTDSLRHHIFRSHSAFTP